MQWRLKFSNLLCFVWVFRVISLMISERQQKMISPSSTKYVKHLLYSKLPRQTDLCLHGKHSNILHTRSIAAHCLPSHSGPVNRPTPTQLNYYFPGFCPYPHLSGQRADILCWLNIVCLSSVWVALRWGNLTDEMTRSVYIWNVSHCTSHLSPYTIPPSLYPTLPRNLKCPHSHSDNSGLNYITLQSTDHLRYQILMGKGKQKTLSELIEKGQRFPAWCWDERMFIFVLSWWVHQVVRFLNPTFTSFPRLTPNKSRDLS